MLKLPKRFSPDFSRPGVKPTGPVELDYSVIDQSAYLHSWFRFDSSNRALRSGACVTLNSTATLSHEGLTLDGIDGAAQVDNTFAIQLNDVLTGDFSAHIKVKNSNPSQTNAYVINNGVNKFVIIYGFVTRTYETFINASFRETIKQIAVDDTSSHLISIIRKGSNFKVFFDGELVVDKAGPTGALTGDMFIGGSSLTTDNFNGIVEDLVFVGEAQSSAFCRTIGKDFYSQLKPQNEPYYFTAAGAVGEVLEAGTATYSLGSDSVNFLRSTIFIAGTASYTLNSDPVNLLHGRVSNLDTATYSLGGDDVTFTVSAFPVMSADVGVYSLGSDDVTFLINRVINLDVGSYTLSGDDVTFTYTAGDTLLVDVGVYSLDSDTVTFSRDYTLAASTASYNLTFTDANFTVAAFRTPDCFTYLTSKITESEFLTGALDVEATFLQGAIDPNGQGIIGPINDDDLYLSGVICT